MNCSQTFDINDLLPSSGPVKFNFQPLKSSGCLTEACAVANYTKKRDGVDDNRFLTLCFDIGGSTSDISALCKMKSLATGLTEISMVKQSSIRFAAQRVANATKYSSGFKDVILRVCSQFAKEKTEISDLLHRIQTSYSNETAPYYYEQIVNTFSDDQLIALYREIRNGCPELMAINLYVTGLITFYAGQLTGKLVRDIQGDNEENALNPLPMVNITFAGKGSRIFEWFVQTEPDYAKEYYNNMFLAGIGGLQEAQQIIQNFFFYWPSTSNLSQVKYEVSKGLASINSGNIIELMIPQENINIELIGEDSFEIKYGNDRHPLKYTDTITPIMMKHIGSFFNISSNYNNDPCPKFWNFIDLFGGWAINLLQFRMTPEEFKAHCAGMSINTFIKNLPDYQKAANKGDNFDYVAPIFILEGMKFYDILIQTIKEKY